jgi:hypothetical protein
MTKDEALKLALEALDCICSPLHVREITKVVNAMKAIKETLAQPETEPVAIRLSNGVIDVLGGALVPIGTLLYTTPPKREWVGLTDEQYQNCAQAMDAEPLVEGWIELIKFARAIDAKLRELNT